MSQLYLDTNELVAAFKAGRLERRHTNKQDIWTPLSAAEFYALLPTVRSYILAICPVTGRDAIEVTVAQYSPDKNIITWVGGPELRISNPPILSSPRKMVKKPRGPEAALAELPLHFKKDK